MAETIKGLVFSPTDDQLTDGYLRSYLHRTRLDDLPSVSSSYFHVADVYSASPDNLLSSLAPAPGTGNNDGDGRVWYVLTPVRFLGKRKARTVGGGGGCWHAEGGPKDVRGSAAGGKLQKFSYRIRTDSGSGVVKPGWLMVEYSLPGSEHVALCKLYRSPRSSRYSTTAPSMMTTSSATASGSKRKAEEEEAEYHPDAPARIVRRRRTPPLEEGQVMFDHVRIAGRATS